MPIDITVPRLGWSMEEGTFVEWLKQHGELIQPGDLIYSLEGDKSTQEIEALETGILSIPADGPVAGDVVRVGQRIGYLLQVGETAPSSVDLAEPPVAEVRTDATPAAAPPVFVSRASRHAIGRRGRPGVVTSLATVATPRARRAAQRLAIPLPPIAGTGRDGRIRERDVLSAAASQRRKLSPEFLPTAAGQQHAVSKVRRSIAQRMVAAIQHTAPVTLTTKVNATELVACRTRAKLTAADRPVPTYTDILIKLVAESLPRCPLLNACWHDDGLYIYDQINIAFAVDTDYGLVAPVIFDVARLSLSEIAVQSRALIERARAGALAEQELQQGTFTVTNLGMFGIDYFTPIINLPQSAILGMGRIVREPVVQGDVVVVGTTLRLSLTFDHRVIDGAPAARWLQQLADPDGIRREPSC